MTKRILLALTLAASLGGAVLACNSPSGTSGTGASAGTGSSPAASVGTGASDAMSSDAMSSDAASPAAS
jgi:hypothetical protein